MIYDFARFLRDDRIEVSQACQYFDTLFMGGISTLTFDGEDQNEFLFVVANNRDGNPEVFY